jgi:chemotaxis protein MotA
MATVKKAGSRPDLGSIAGLVVAVGGILTGLMLDKGKITDVVQVSAALVVLGGTVGATMVASSLSALLGALGKLGLVFFERSQPIPQTIDALVSFAAQARKEGIVSLEQEASKIDDPFLRKALNLAVDGKELSQIRHMMELEIEVMEQRCEAEAKVYEAAGGFAPTIGIIGAVLGLMQVMKSLANIDEVGRGIASAFVATVYGVGVANLFFLPAGSKLKARLKSEVQLREMMLEGVLGIVEGLNPKVIRTKLEAYLPASPGKKQKAGSESGAPAAAAAAES